MDQQNEVQCTAFDGFRGIASGKLAHVAFKAKEVIDQGSLAPVLIFDDTSGRLVEVDFRGTPDDVLRRLAEMASPRAVTRTPTPSEKEKTASESPQKVAPRGAGRPKLGVVAREVTLLPRHWDWLNSQPGGASVALRKLVEHARRANADKDRVRLSQEAANRFMSALAGDLAGFEEATRALFTGNRECFDEHLRSWPTDVRNYARKLAAAALGEPCGDGWVARPEE